jgi:hypothetical protein
MTRIRVGLPLVPGVEGYEEGVHYNYTPGGHDLRVSIKEPGPSEVQAVQRGPAVFALASREDALFILSRFGDLPWRAAHYNWWINPPVLRPDPWADMDRLAGGFQASVCLVDASTGILEALRTVRLSLELSRLFIRMVQVQMAPPFDPWRYLEIVEQTRREDFNAGNLLKEAVCMCAADLPVLKPLYPGPQSTFH